ncbi:phosphatidylglycerophosphatase A [bacterium]|nr:phosphatidylglycerophosphatase A [bacterium]
MTDPAQIPSDIPVRRRPIRDWRVWLAVGFGLGIAPFAPGTFGSLWGPVLVWGLSLVGIKTWMLFPVAAILFGVGIPICAAGARHFELKDPPWVVFDEIAAYPLVFALTEQTWTTGIIGFLLFRFFDILKPWPIKRFEYLPGGLGIMADDYFAAFHAMVLLKVISMMMGAYG